MAKTKVITLRVDDEQHKRLEAAAEYLSVPISFFIRDVALERAERVLGYEAKKYSLDEMKFDNSATTQIVETSARLEKEPREVVSLFAAGD